MKKLLLLLLLLPAISVNTQELDSAFLESLPEEIQKDVLDRAENRNESEKPIYRRPSTMIRKNYCSDIKDEYWMIEDNYNSMNFNDPSQEYSDKSIYEDCIPKSERFGSNFFDKMQSSFMPINEPNLDSSYILDFGDSLQIQLVGQKNSMEEFLINRDGSISIPEIGKVFLAGISLDDANTLI